MPNNQKTNEELAQLGTHASAATDIFKGRTTKTPQQIKEPEVPNPTRYDTRTGHYE